MTEQDFISKKKIEKKKKYKKLSQVLWHTPVVPATWEAEAEELLEPRRWRLQWAKIMPLHSSLGDRLKLSLKKQKRVNKNQWAIERVEYINTFKGLKTYRNSYNILR